MQDLELIAIGLDNEAARQAELFGRGAERTGFGWLIDYHLADIRRYGKRAQHDVCSLYQGSRLDHVLTLYFVEV